MNFKNYILFLIFTLSLALNSYSSHISGGDVTYKCIGPNQYEITVKLFRDCDGISAPTSVYVYFNNTCGLPNPSSVTCTRVNNPITGLNYTNISQLCKRDSLNSTCFFGSLPGMQLYEYRGIVTFPAPCNSWTMYYTTCCRNSAVTNVSASGTYLGAVLNSQTAPCNNSPVYTSHPVPYVCVNQLVNYNFGVVEPDGDSLVYQFIAATQNNPPTALTYSAPYSPTMPISGIVLDPATGQLTFTPNTVGHFVVVVRVTEYDPVTGQVKGSNFRDIQFVVQNCNNQVVNPANIAITNHTGAGTVNSNKEFEACEGDSYCFDLSITDPNAGDSVFVSSNIASALSGATVTYTGANPVTARVCGTILPGTNRFNVINFDVRDNACPIVGQANFSITVKVIPNTIAQRDTTICLGGSANLSATGGTIFNWTAISGPALVTGTNISCNPCANPVVSPTATTTYEVTSNLTGGCKNKDTVTVTVVGPQAEFDADIYSGCYPVVVNFTNNTDPASFSTAYWDFGNDTSGTNPVSETVTYNTPGVYDVYLRVTSATGCVSDTTITGMIEVYDYPEADFQASPQPTNVSSPTIYFEDLSSSDVVLWDWNFGVNDPSFPNTSLLQNPIVTYPDLRGDIYTVKLIVANQFGCYDSIQRDVIIHDLYNLYLPNSFTPNNDGVNDDFGVVGEQIDATDFEFRIFDRWGNLIFFTNDPNERWDGTKDNVKQLSGIYSWRIHAVDANNGKAHKYMGHVSLMR